MHNLTIKEKNNYFGVQIYYDEIFKAIYLKPYREIIIMKLNSMKYGLITGFSYVCEGYQDEFGNFVAKRKIPCIVVTKNIKGSVVKIPMSHLPKVEIINGMKMLPGNIHQIKIKGKLKL